MRRARLRTAFLAAAAAAAATTAGAGDETPTPLRLELPLEDRHRAAIIAIEGDCRDFEVQLTPPKPITRAGCSALIFRTG